MSYFPGYGSGFPGYGGAYGAPFGAYSGYGGYGGYGAGYGGMAASWGNPAASFAGLNGGYPGYGYPGYAGYGGYGGYGTYGGSVAALPTQNHTYEEVPFQRQVTEFQPVTHNIQDSYTVENIQYNIPRTHLEPTVQMIPAYGVQPRTYYEQMQSQIVHPPYSPVSMLKKSGMIPNNQSYAHTPYGTLPYPPQFGQPGPYGSVAGPYGSVAGLPQGIPQQGGPQQNKTQFPQNNSFAPGGNPLFGQSGVQGIKSTRDNYDSLQ